MNPEPGDAKKREKEVLRRETERRRKTLPPEFAAEASRRIVERLRLLESFRAADCVALYLALPGEVDLDPLIPVCRDAGKTIAVPVFDSARRIYLMARLDPDVPPVEKRFGIREPAHPAPLPLDAIDLMLVPGVAFDRTGGRLGRGGGYYDRLMKGFAGSAIGIAFEVQLVERVPRAPHDRSVERVLTESGVHPLPQGHAVPPEK